MLLQQIYTKEELESMSNRELLFEYKTIVEEIELHKASHKNVDSIMKLIKYRSSIGNMIIQRMENN